MPSSIEPLGPRQPSSALQVWAGFERWNRKLHFYVGLFLLFFVWLFAFSGLILNHPSWGFTEFWTNRTRTDYERDITAPGPDVKGDLGQAREIMGQLGIVGEILWTTTRTDTNQFDFQVRRPGHFFFIKADLARQRVAVQQGDVNLWGKVRTLHTFTGVQMDDPRNNRDWCSRLCGPIPWTPLPQASFSWSSVVCLCGSNFPRNAFPALLCSPSEHSCAPGFASASAGFFEVSRELSE